MREREQGEGVKNQYEKQLEHTQCAGLKNCWNVKTAG